MGDELEIMENVEPQEEIVEEVEGEYVVTNGMDDTDDLGYLEEVETQGDEYGGMPHHVYDAIVEFKRSNVYPEFADQRVDRSAHCHWRLRCSRFLLADDGETLLHGAPDTPREMCKFVVKKGEVKAVVDRIHSLIGHLGLKRTQSAIMRKLYWRSVRNDVKTFVGNCDFCNQKKAQGRKIIKAPIDIQSENFDLDIMVGRPRMNGERSFSIHLMHGDEEQVRQIATTRMTTYTFRSTDPEHRKVYSNPPFFKRQPYLKRSRYDLNTPTGYLIPIINSNTREQTFMAVPSDRIESIARPSELKQPKFMDEDDDEVTPVDPSVASPAGGSGVPRRLTKATVSSANWRSSGRERNGRQRRKERAGSQTIEGAASRLSSALTERILGASEAARVAKRNREPGMYPVVVGEDVVTTYEDASRPEWSPLAPVLLMPSMDPEVTEMQKQLLRRQIKVQDMQMRVLQAQLDAYTGNEVGRYEEVAIDSQDGTQEDMEELNVIDNDNY